MALLTFLMPLLNSLLGGVIQPFVKAYSDYRLQQLKTNAEGFEAATVADMMTTKELVAAEVQIDALKVQLYGTPTYRIITLIAGLPPAIHFGLVYIDTILASSLFLGHAVIGVPKLPAPYDTFEWAIVSSFFLIRAVNAGTSNVRAWLEKK